MVTVPDKLKPLFPGICKTNGAFSFARRRPLKRLRLTQIAVRAVFWLTLQLALAAASYFYISSVMNSKIVFTAYVNGHKVAAVSNPDIIRRAIADLVFISTDLNADFDSAGLPPITKVPGFDFKESYKASLSGAFGSPAPASVSFCTDRLYGIVRENYTYAFTVYAENKIVGASARYSDAERAIKKIEEILTEAAICEGQDLDEVRICTRINVAYGLIERPMILSEERLFNRLSKLLAPDIVSGSNVVSVSAVCENPDVEYGVNRIITINGCPAAASAAPALLTENIKLETAVVIVNYKTRYVESADYYIGEMFTRTEGVDGLERITYDLVMDGGDVAKRRIALREVVAAPVDEVIVVGMSPLPLPVPTGSFDYPVKLPCTITSHFAEKREEFDGDAFHYGVDFSGAKGEPIYAADGGKIIYAGYSQSYGLMTQIDHGNGFTSVYAHCSKLLFNIGENVYKGQQIAQIGDTGITTGTHLHFEIRNNGVYVNPLKFLDK